MKIVVFGPEKRTGALVGNEVVDLSLAHAKYLREKQGERHPIALATALVPHDLWRFIEGGRRALDGAQTALDHLANAADRKGPRGDTLAYPADSVKLHAPRAQGARVACAGGNFADHTEAMYARAAARGEPRPKSDGLSVHDMIRKTGIWGFWKVDRESLGQDGIIPYPARARRLDYEGELAVVISKRGKDIRARDIKDYVWGVTLLGDWSIRLFPEPGHVKFVMQKNFDGCCSIGPCIVVDEGIDPSNTMIETWVNGERRQNYNTKDMVFSFGEYLEYLSGDFTFHAGDMIAGGTAAGTAADSSPLLPDGTPAPEPFLKPGDKVEIRSPGIGVLRTAVVEKA